jgi:hypothetical protein
MLPVLLVTVMKCMQTSKSDSALVSLTRGREAATSERNMIAASRSVLPVPDAKPERPEAVRVDSASDPRLEGRVVYTIAVQMPNVTSYLGQLDYLVRRTRTGWRRLSRDTRALAAPKSRSQVRRGGSKRAVIRKSGRVEAVALLRGLEAPSRCEFEPALRNGLPVDVNAVMEIRSGSRREAIVEKNYMNVAICHRETARAAEDQRRNRSTFRRSERFNFLNLLHRYVVIPDGQLTWDNQ